MSSLSGGSPLWGRPSLPSASFIDSGRGVPRRPLTRTSSIVGRSNSGKSPVVTSDARLRFADGGPIGTHSYAVRRRLVSMGAIHGTLINAISRHVLTTVTADH